MPDNKIIPLQTSRKYTPINSEQLVTPEYAQGLESLGNYDRGLRGGVDQRYLRGANQSGIQQIGNAVARSIPSVIAKMGEGFAGTVSLISEAAKAPFTGKMDWDAAFDSPFMKAFSDLEQAAENQFPIYGSQKYLEGNLAQQLWTTSFWTQDVADGLEFLASAYLPGTQLSKVGKA